MSFGGVKENVFFIILFLSPLAETGYIAIAGLVFC